MATSNNDEVDKACSDEPIQLYVDVIVPVYNAEETIEETVRSAMNQVVPEHLLPTIAGPSQIKFTSINWDVAVCCYDDGSNDNSWNILCRLKDEFETNFAELKSTSSQQETAKKTVNRIQTKILIGRCKDGPGRGAGYARNQAALLRSKQSNYHMTKNALYFLCLLDSDDTMHPNRIAEQIHAMISLPEKQMIHTIMGCNFDRDPPDSTWHYANWANNLTDDRLMLERFREVTVLQPTWMLTKSRFDSIGGYIEAPHQHDEVEPKSIDPDSERRGFQLVHPSYDTPQTLRLAEDLRFVHAHLHTDGLLRLHRTVIPLVTYRHRLGMSQSSQTPRKLLLHIRVLAFENAVLRSDPLWLQNGGLFVVWGAGRDGKDFVKALSKDLRKRVACFADVDRKKIESGHYVNKEIETKIPIVHFSVLASDPSTRKQLHEAWENEELCQDDNDPHFGRIDKSNKIIAPEQKATSNKQREVPLRPNKKRKVQKKAKKGLSGLDESLLPSLPVVVCVAMYRTNGVLEKNVQNIGRTEGKDLWHFS